MSNSIIFERENKPSHIWLQWHGWQPAIKAGELKPGMVTMWNGGTTETIKSVTRSKSGKTVSVSFVSESGYEGTRKFNYDRLVAIA